MAETVKALAAAVKKVRGRSAKSKVTMAFAATLASSDVRPSDSVRLEGSLPAWLAGRLLRTAPAVFRTANFQAHHWFDALGILYTFELSPAGVRYKERLLDSHYAAQAQSGAVRSASFGTPMQRSFLRRVFEPIPEPTDNANVNVLRMGSDWVALTESPYQLVVDPGSLEVQGRVQYTDRLPSGTIMTAHPQFDFERGLVVNLGTVLGRRAELHAYAHAPDSRERIVFGRISLSELPYVHSFGLSAGALVVIAHPFQCAPYRVLWSNRGFIDHFEYRPELGTRLHVLDRKGAGAPRTFETEAFFTFHTVNTFEDGQDLVLDLLAYPDAAIVDSLRVDAIESGLPPLRPSFRRVRMHPNGRTSHETVSDPGFEFPSIDYRRVQGKRQRYVWGSTAMADGKDVVGVDLESGVVRHFGIEGHRFGEPVFVGRPGASEEADGVLLSVGSSQTRAALAVLDARTLEPRALAHLESPIPLGFHGSFSLTG